VQEAVALALLSGVVVNIIYTSVSLTYLTAVPALQMVRQTLTPAVLGAYGYFLIAAALASTMLGHGFDGLWRASGLFVLAIAIGDSVGGRSIRTFLERQLADSEPHIQYSRFAQGTFHDLRNHVAAALANLREIDIGDLKADDASAMSTAIAALDDARHVLAAAQDTGRSSSLTSFTRVDLAELCRYTAALHRRHATNRRISVVSDTPDSEVAVFGNAVLLGEVITNLVLNAVDACRPGGTVLVQCRAPHSSPAVVVSDSGGGVPEELADRIFEPGFTTKREGGHGLGLYTALGIARQHHGDLIYEPDPARSGARFALLLPDYVRGERDLRTRAKSSGSEVAVPDPLASSGRRLPRRTSPPP